LGAATRVSPELVGAAMLAGAALLALRVREDPRLRDAFGAALLVALAPWVALKLALPAAAIALSMARWLRRRNRGLAGFAALEVVLPSVMVYVTIDDRLFGGLTPYAGHEPTGVESAGDVLARVPRVAGLFLDRDAGLLRWAPFGALAFVALWLLWRSRRERLAAAISDQANVDSAATLLVLVCGAVVITAAFLS